MLLKLAAALGAIALFIPAPALAEWVYVSSDEDGQIFVEDNSITTKGRDTFFIKRTFYAFPEDGAIATMAYSSIDCSTGVRSLYRLIGFNEHGAVVFDEKQGVAKAAPAPYGSHGATIRSFVCP